MRWWAEYPAMLFGQRVVGPLQKLISDELLTTSWKLGPNSIAAIKVLALVERANRLGQQLPAESFYNEFIKLEYSLSYSSKLMVERPLTRMAMSSLERI